MIPSRTLNIDETIKGIDKIIMYHYDQKSEIRIVKGY